MTDYVGIAEAMPLADLTLFMSTFFESQGRTISANGGTISNFIGDNIMACWDQPANAQLACESALAQCNAMKVFGAWATARSYPSPTFRIGINTGMMNIQRGPPPHDLTILGDAVNTASRLDQLNKSYGTRILLSEFTREGLNASLVVRPVDVVRIKGKEKPVQLFELIGSASEIESEQGKFLQRYDSAFSSYLQGHFGEAIAAFEEAQHLRPGDHPTEILISRCREYVSQPPKQPWEGVFTFRTS